ncbi:hypothetical protein [Pantoea cypripedii]|uniref:Ubiquitin-activating enzyme E1 FCCH domain-containing protein n=1 Tax=Pantoea cypripedii TaxID=55209 RepID=A0A6B9GAS8_PANCY|nr:hypothetical protein [Pantoea cypripedii]QGY29765.1 hypothetical protein CUN67_12835 [Pantoea cypripedii]
MPRNNVALLAFNRGILSPLALARTDIERVALSAEVQTNWMPRLLGSMMLRPGLGYIGRTKGDSKARFLPFVFATDDTALLEFTDKTMRVWVDDELITRDSVSTAITNGSFTTDLSGWTDADGSASSSVWSASGMSLTGSGYTSAARYQQVTVASGDIGKTHALRITIARGPVTLRIGSTAGGDDYVSETSMLEGENSIAFVPTGDFYVRFSNSATYPVLVRSVAVEASGTLEVVTPWTESDIGNIKYTQSADVIFVGCDGFQQYRIERRDNGSWSVVKYYSDDGPFELINTTGTTITPSAISGEITLTASDNVFNAKMVGSLVRLVSSGQLVSSTLTGEAQYTDYIKVTGSGDSRRFYYAVQNSDAVGTLTLQRSVGDPGAWVDVTTFDATNKNTSYLDDYDNTTIYYRIGFNSGDYTSGSATVNLEFTGGSITGIARITGYSSATLVYAIVLQDMGNAKETSSWYLGSFSASRGYPTAVAIYEGRLWWAGSDRIYGSYSDAYASFDDGYNTVEQEAGDASGISYSIGYGPVDTINWLLPLLRLLAGTQGCEASIQSSSYGEVITPDNFHIKYPSTQGSNAAGAVILDSRGIFVHRSGRRVYELSYSSDSYDYSSTDLTEMWPECGDSVITRIAAQRLPDDRIHCVREDGTVAVLVRDPSEDMRAWIEVETDGTVEDVVTLPGDEEDRVYYVVNRNGFRCLERWAKESECIGGNVCKLADSHVVYEDSTGSGVTSISGLDHIEGKTVVVWADGKDAGTQTVSGGSISLGATYSNIVAGLAYTAQYKSSKLAYAAGMGTALAQRKRVDHLALIMRNTHYQGIKYGSDFDRLDDLPLEEMFYPTESNKVWDSYDHDSFEFDGSWDTDSRICLEASAPRPVTVLAAVVSIATHDK